VVVVPEVALMLSNRYLKRLVTKKNEMKNERKKIPVPPKKDEKKKKLTFIVPSRSSLSHKYSTTNKYKMLVSKKERNESINRKTLPK
jgi:hypothetical protein